MFNLSYEYKSFLWLPPKTGSMRAHEIFEKFGFITQTSEKKIIYDTSTRNKKLFHHHNMELFETSENYQLICTARNPYSRMVSYFKTNNTNPLDNNNEVFLNFLMSFFYRSKNDKIFGDKIAHFNENWNKRIPDYYIRLESMYEDYLKIPFVKDTELYQSGELKQLCETKKNENTSNKRYWKEYYDEECADIVYYNFSKYFEKLNYDRKSYL